MTSCLAACAGEGLMSSSRQTPAPTPVPTAPKPPPPPLPAYRGPSTRPFYMGFTEWPADLTDDGAALALPKYAGAHGDIVSVMFIGGIPWPEALDGKPFSKPSREFELQGAGGKKIVLIDFAVKQG